MRPKSIFWNIITDHSLHFLVERHGPIQHVIENRGHFFPKREIGDCVVAFFKNFNFSFRSSAPSWREWASYALLDRIQIKK
jgi:hypothetical protein